LPGGHLSVIPKRMLTKGEAAHHCGRPVKHFVVECPVQGLRNKSPWRRRLTPISFANGDLRYDVRDLDTWLDRLKSSSDDDAEAIVARLG